MNKSATSFPGDDIVTNPMIQLTYSIEIDADPAAIWPWLVQVGYHRGGWYIDRWSDRIEQQYFWPILVPPEARGTWQPPADEILTEFQNLKIGDTIPDGPPGSAYYEVVALEYQQLMVLLATTHFKYLAPQFVRGTRFEPNGAWSWAFILEPVSGSKAKLTSRWRGTGEPRLYINLIKPFIWLIDQHQQREILKGIKRRAERKE
jgi:hypothetical protein